MSAPPVEAPRFYPYLSGRKNLELVAGLDGGDARTRIDEALDVVDLADRAKDRVGGYSHGMRQRLGIAGALIRAPKLLVLDEPATGLDPAGMRDMRILIGNLAEQGITVLLSSHQLAEVEEICDRVAILATGRVIFEGALDDLRASAPLRFRLVTSDDARGLAVCLAQHGVRDAVRPATGGIVFHADDASLDALSTALVEAGLGIRALVPETATLEELFFKLTETAPEPVPAGRTASLVEVA